MSGHPVPVEALDADISILGKKGGGKTYTAKGIVERLLAMGRRVLVLDPLGVWAGLRTGADGATPGFPIAIFGGDHGDLPLDPAAAEPLAGIIANENLPAVIDLSDLSKGAQQGFLCRFLHELRRANRNPLTLVLEEADVFAPQNPQGDDSKVLHGEVDWIARRGRFRGFRLITITQRPARLSKDVLTQAATLIVHRLPAPQDRDAVKAWVEGNGDREKAREVFDTLATLAIGEAWVWSTEVELFGRFRFPAIATLDTSSTPRAGERRIEPKTLAEVDVSAIRAALGSSAEARETASGRDTRRGEALAVQRARRESYEAGYAEGLAAGRAATLADLDGSSAPFIRACEAAAATWRAWLEQARRGDRLAPPAPVTADAQPAKLLKRPVACGPKAEVKPAAAGPGGLSASARKLLAAFNAAPFPISWDTAALIAALSPTGGNFNTAKRALIEGKHVVADARGEWAPAERDPDAQPFQGAAVRAAWIAKLGGSAGRILEHLGRVGRDETTWSAVAAELGLSPTGGNWNLARKALRTNGLVNTGSAGRVSLSRWLV